MAGILTNYGSEVIAERSFNDASASVDHELILYSNDYTPDKTTELADLTEVNAAGYSRITLTDGSWVVDTTANVTTLSYAEQTFTLTAASDIGGWAVVDDTDEVIMAQENDSANTRIDPEGDVNVTPVCTVAEVA